MQTGLNKQDHDRLYEKWRAIQRDECGVEFESIREFRNWSKNNGYGYGMRLVKVDEELPYSPENCRWIDPGDTAAKDPAIGRQWDEFIASLRKPPKTAVRDCWRYEHPDIVRARK